MFRLLTCRLKWKWASSLNRIKPRSPGLFSILLTKFTPSLLTSVCFWRIWTFYGNNFKSLWMTLCTVILEVLTSWDSRFVGFCGDCSRRSLTVWTIVMCSESTIPSPVTFIVISYTSSVSKFLENLCYRLSAWSLSPRKFPAKLFGLGPLILLKSNFAKFSTFCALKIGL